jgi:DNA-binding CsgD family transcriptional regulator/tetratricopeptide (TPR) repeat protein
VDLLERDEHLGVLVALLAAARSAGRLVLVSGEAGAGKTALVQRLLADHPTTPALVGRCDDLFAPRPLGPLTDIARSRPGPLAEALAAGDQGGVFDAFLAELDRPDEPVIVVLEDVQWADEATLDLVRFVARRLDSLRCLLVVTHRDDVPARHPLRRASGALVGPAVTRIHLRPLSVAAVRALVADRPVDAVSLHERTGGNPFFVVEVLDGEPGSLPATVRDAVLARTVSLSGAARDALDAAAVLGRQVGTDLIEVVGDCDAAAVDECLAAGLLVDDGGHQAFRHELSRQAVDEAMTPLRRRQLHARALDALGVDGDIVQRAHHAVGAGDRAVIADLAARAADHCVGLGAKRQAADLYGQALQHGQGLDPAERIRLLDARARTCQLVEQLPEAIEAAEELLALLRAAGDDLATGAHEAWLSCLLHNDGRPVESERRLATALQRLEPLGPSPALAQALGQLAGHSLVTGDFAASITAGRRAHALADDLGLDDVAVYAMDMYGTSMAGLGDDEGLAVIRESLDRAKRAGLANDVALAAGNLAGMLLARSRPGEALAVLDDGLAVAEEHELRFRTNCLTLSRAEAFLALGRWDEAASVTTDVLSYAGLTTGHLLQGYWHLGRVRAVRGDPNPLEALDLALSYALELREPQFIVPIHLARAEAAWLIGDHDTARREVEATLPHATRCDPWMLRDVALHVLRAGIDWEPDDPPLAPFAEASAGDHRAVVRFWDEHGLPYRAADALAESDDVDDLREAHERLVLLQARPRAQQVARKLRDLGARHVPRGPRASTQANAAGLTAREAEVTGLLAEGLTNAEIAERLVLSPKTVDHHVSAVLSKLGVPTRRQVASAAQAAGIDLKDGVAPAAM